MLKASISKLKRGTRSLFIVFAAASIAVSGVLPAGTALATPEPTPVNLKAYVGGNSIALLWNPAAGSTPTAYKVYRGGVLKATVSPSVINNSGTVQRWVDTAVTNGTTYGYQVSAMNAANEESTKTTTLNVTQPSSPTPVPTITLDPSIPAAYVTAMTNMKNTLLTWYPKMNYALGSVSGTPTSLTLRTEPNTGYAAYASGTTITVDEGWLAPVVNDPAASNIIIHEGTHIIQLYGSTSWAVEGIADYMMRVWYGVDPTLTTASNVNGTWMNGYDYVAKLLNYVSVTYNKPNLVKDFHVSLGTTYPASYNLSFFKTQTGRTLGELWEEMTGKRVSSPTFFKNVASSFKCMDVLNANTSNGNPLQLQTCVNGQSAQQFEWIADSATSNQGEIRVMNKCVDVSGSGTADGTVVQIWDCNTGAAQKWIMMIDGSLKNPNSGKCLQPVAGGITVGTTMEIKTCDGTDTQDWFQRPIGMLKSFYGQACGGPTSSTVAGSVVTMYSCTSGLGSGQTISFAPSAVGSTQGALKANGYCFQPVGGSTAANTLIEVNSCTGANIQKWQWQSDNTVKNIGSGLCLTLPAWASPWQLTQTTCTSPTNLKKWDVLYQY